MRKNFEGSQATYSGDSFEDILEFEILGHEEDIFADFLKEEGIISELNSEVPSGNALEESFEEALEDASKTVETQYYSKIDETVLKDLDLIGYSYDSAIIYEDGLVRLEGHSEEGSNRIILGSYSEPEMMFKTLSRHMDEHRIKKTEESYVNSGKSFQVGGVKKGQGVENRYAQKQDDLEASVDLQSRTGFFNYVEKNKKSVKVVRDSMKYDVGLPEHLLKREAQIVSYLSRIENENQPLGKNKLTEKEILEGIFKKYDLLMRERMDDPEYSEKKMHNADSFYNQIFSSNEHAQLRQVIQKSRLRENGTSAREDEEMILKYAMTLDFIYHEQNLKKKQVIDVFKNIKHNPDLSYLKEKSIFKEAV